MMCRKFRRDLIELARGGAAGREVAAHLESCSDCARFLEDQIALTSAMRVVASEAGSPSAALEGRVMAELPQRRMPVWRLAAAAGLAAAACLSGLWLLRPTPVPPPLAKSQPFITIPYTVPLTPEEPTAVWHARIPVSALVAVGFRVNGADPSTLVEADVLVGQDGRARAIRPIAVSIIN